MQDWLCEDRVCTACKLPNSPVCDILLLTFTAALVCAEIGAEKLEGDESASRPAAQHELASCAFRRLVAGIRIIFVDKPCHNNTIRLLRSHIAASETYSCRAHSSLCDASRNQVRGQVGSRESFGRRT